MITETSTPSTDHDHSAPTDSAARALVGRITRLEMMVAALIAAVMLALVVVEPNILEAPFENERTLLFTFGGTAIAAIAFVAMLWLRIPSVIRVLVLVVPFVIVNWWLISPYFLDDVVEETFSTSISEQIVTAAAPDATAATGTPDVTAGDEATAPPDSAPQGEPVQGEPPASTAPMEVEPSSPTGPVLLGAGQFVGLAGHSGVGDAGIFESPDGSLVLRFENFDIENGPDLEVYLVPGADQTSLPDGSIHLGALKGNIGDQNYELPAGTELAPGAYTALVWCEAFSVEFVGATIVV